MKKLIVVLASLMFATGAFAAEYKLTGDFYVRGSKIANQDFAKDADYDYYDQDMNLYAVIKVDEKTTVTTQFSLFDVNWNGGANDVDESGDNSKFAVERAFMSYKITPELTVNAGLMNAGAWGGVFGDYATYAERIKFDYSLGKTGMITAYAQKNAENGKANASSYKDAEKGDNDALAIGAKLNFAGVKVQPLFVMGTDGEDNDAGNTDGKIGYKKTNKLDLYVGAKIAMVNLDFDYIQVTGTADKEYRRSATTGQNFATNSASYVDVDIDQKGYRLAASANLGAFNVGAEYAYASGESKNNADTEEMGIGGDYEFLVFGDFYGDADDQGPKGVTVMALTAGTTMGKLALDAAYVNIYASDDQFDGGKTGQDINVKDGEALGTEIDLAATYKLTDATSLKLAYGMLDPVSELGDKTMSRMYWKLSTKF